MIIYSNLSEIVKVAGNCSQEIHFLSREIHFSLRMSIFFIQEIHFFSGNCQVMSPHHSGQMSQVSWVAHVGGIISSGEIYVTSATGDVFDG